MHKFQEYCLTKKTDELKKLIAENPDLPIVVVAGEEANNGDYSWMYCSDISFELMELLDCDYLDNNDCVFTDRDWLEEVVRDRLCDDYENDTEYEAAVKAKLTELEPYWQKVIAISATN